MVRPHGHMDGPTTVVAESAAKHVPAAVLEWLASSPYGRSTQSTQQPCSQAAAACSLRAGPSVRVGLAPAPRARPLARPPAPHLLRPALRHDDAALEPSDGRAGPAVVPPPVVTVQGTRGGGCAPDKRRGVLRLTAAAAMCAPAILAHPPLRCARVLADGRP